ncbi:hypothetical protein ACFWP0_23565 [Achromobacter sp. NPDC058515]|uniref:hypothetical protein n=1 Tax=Achromobacter sp. NPDC058515 TaxID=3346533 RepID=UPI00364A0A63
MGVAGKGTDRQQNVGELLTICGYGGIRDNPATLGMQGIRLNVVLLRRPNSAIQNKNIFE